MKYIIIILISIFFSACATKMTIKAIKPSIVSDSDIKQVSIKSFKNDRIGLKNIISADMKNVKFNNKYYFEVVNRDITNTILEEQKLQDSGLVDNTGEIEGLSDVRSIISGEITRLGHTKQYYYQDKIDYTKCITYKYDKNKKKICKTHRKYKQRCENNQYVLDFSIYINKVSNAKSIYSRNFSRNKTISRCDFRRVPKSKTQVYKMMSKNISTLFLRDITPTFDYYQVEVLKDEDIFYNSNQKVILEKSIELIGKSKINKANKYLAQLVYLTKEKSYVALYNYALTQEALGDLQKASTNYKKAMQIANKKGKTKEIRAAIYRLEKSIENKSKANKQILKDS